MITFVIVSAGCASEPPPVHLPPPGCEERELPSKQEARTADPSSWLDRQGSLRLEFELEGMDPSDTSRAMANEVAKALRARIREAGIPDARVSGLNLRQVVIDIPLNTPPALLERARERILASGLSVKLVFTVESLVGPAVP